MGDTGRNWVQDERDMVDAIELPAAGTRRRGYLRFSHPTLAEWAWPYTVIRGAEDGPHLAVISGVHPAEYPAIEANIRFARDLDPRSLRGTVVSLPLIDVPAFLTRTPFVCPIDGKNPNRCMPGDPHGTFTEVMNDALFRAIIRPADALVDLHGGDMVEALVPFTIYATGGGDAVDARARAMGLAYGLPYLVASAPQRGGSGGTTVRAAADAGIPAILTEAGACGLLTELETRQHEDGLSNILRHLGMTEGNVPAPLTPIIELDRFTVVSAPTEGMWYPGVIVGDLVLAGETVGRIGSLFGDHLADITAPHDGYILYATSSPAMREGGLALAIGA